MKRREFLASSISAGVLLPRIGLGDSKPCPPPAVAVSGGTASDGNCVANRFSAVPSWFADLADRTWTFVGAGTNAAKITDGAGIEHPVHEWQKGRSADQSWATFVGTAKSNGGFARAIADWGGGCVDDSYGELIIFGGGHSSYYGNDIHAIALREEVPAWRCLNADTMTPEELQVGPSCSVPNPVAAYADGQAAPPHSWNSIWSVDGNLWIVGNDAAGYCANSSNSIHKYTRGGRWKYIGHGVGSPGSGNFLLEAAQTVYDPTTRKIYRHYQSSNQVVPGHLFSVDVDTGVIKNDYSNGALSSGSFNGACPAIAIPDRNALMMMRSQDNSGTWLIYDTRNMDAAPRQVRNRPGEGLVLAEGATLTLNAPGSYYQSNDGLASTKGTWNGQGGVYHAPSRAMLTWSGFGANIGKLSIPADPFTGTFTLQQWLPPSPSNLVTPTKQAPASDGSTYGRFNIVRMGQIDGIDRHALVLINGTAEPTWVYKLPAGGI